MATYHSDHRVESPDCSAEKSPDRDRRNLLQSLPPSNERPRRLLPPAHRAMGHAEAFQEFQLPYRGLPDEPAELPPCRIQRGFHWRLSSLSACSSSAVSEP